MPFNSIRSGSVPYYAGGQVPNPANVIINNAAPSSNATGNPLGTLYINPLTSLAYICVANTGPNGSVTWDQLGLSTGTVGSLTGDSGGAITPSAGNINLKGTTNQIVITGTTSTLTWKLASGLVAPGTIATTSGYVGQATATVTAGNIGEYMVSTITSGAAVTTVTSGTVYNIATLNLTAGVWDVTGCLQFTTTSTSAQGLTQVGISTATNSLGTLGLSGANAPTGPVNTAPMTVQAPIFRVGLTGTTSYYLNAASAVTIATNIAYGTFRAVRVA